MPIKTDHSLYDQTMYDNLKNVPLYRENEKAYILINGKYCRILDGLTHSFLEDPIISIGKNLNREIILLDPNSIKLNNLYEELKNELSNKKDIDDILETTLSFTKDSLKTINKDERLNAIKKAPPMYTSSYLSKNQKIINFDYFLEKKIGVCRHKALLNAFLLQKLIQDGTLPPGITFIHRDNSKEVGLHTWNGYLIMDKKKDSILYSLDSKLEKKSIIVDEVNKKSLESTYGNPQVENFKIQAEKIKTLNRVKKNDSSSKVVIENRGQEKKDIITAIINIHKNIASNTFAIKNSPFLFLSHPNTNKGSKPNSINTIMKIIENFTDQKNHPNETLEKSLNQKTLKELKDFFARLKLIADSLSKEPRFFNVRDKNTQEFLLLLANDSLANLAKPDYLIEKFPPIQTESKTPPKPN